jgi:hypothetical protein
MPVLPMTVTLEDFLLALGVGSALIALWFVARFPDKSPAGYTSAILHVCVALLLGPLASHTAPAIWNRGHPLVAIFCVLLPVLVYTFLTAAWFFKLANETIHRYRH